MKERAKRVAVNFRMDRVTARQLLTLQERLCLRSAAEAVEVATTLAHHVLRTSANDDWIRKANKVLFELADLSRCEQRIGRPRGDIAL